MVREQTKPEPEKETTSDSIGNLPEAEQPTETMLETIPEIPVTEVLPEPEMDTKEKLAAEVKARLLACTEDSDCIGALTNRFEQVAKGLGISSGKLIDDVFSLLTGKKDEEG
jgi:hypothetical protein